ncbi:MAG: hypothetical protein AB7P00_26120 [Sandaracinaceae bacterium]
MSVSSAFCKGLASDAVRRARAVPGFVKCCADLADRTARRVAIALALIVVSWAAAARAAEPIAYEVDASVDEGEGRALGTWRAEVRVVEGESLVRLWLYPDRLEATPAALDERNARWIFTGEVDHGGIGIGDVRVDGVNVASLRRYRPVGDPRGRDTLGADLLVPIPPGAARTVIVTLSFDVHVPGRFGRLGHDDGLLSMQAPWYPLVIGAHDAYDFEVPHRVHVRARGRELLLADRRFEGEGRVEASAAYVPLSVAQRFYETRVTSRGVTLVLRTTDRLYEPPPPERRGEAGIIDLARVDVAGMVRDVADQVLGTAIAFDVPVPSQIVLTQMPSRTELVATTPSGVVFSDHLFQIFPLDQTLEYHRRALRRGLFQLLARGLSSVDAPQDRGWADDLRAVALVDLDEARRHHGTASPQDLLMVFSFHPAVDQLLYAPQIAFVDAYFAAIEERDAFRDDPVRARRPLSRGRRILESARDVLEPEAFRRWVAMLVRGRRAAPSALARVDPAARARLASWLAATGEPVNYVLEDRRSERLPDGRYRHTIVVRRVGADRVEPVEVAIDDDRGHHEVGVWDGPGERGEVVFETDGELRSVTIDPRFRLPQAPGLSEGHPRMDDATDTPWRPPILNGVLFNLFVTEGDFTGLLDFALRRRYDLEHTIGLRLERTRAFTGGQLRYTQGVGDLVHENRRAGAVGGALSFDYLHPEYGGGNLAAWRLQASATGSFNTVQYALDPREGYWGAAAVTGGVSFREDGSIGGTFRGGFRVGGIWPLGLVNAIAVIAGGGFTFGDALFSELQSVGGADRLRGYESGELLGRGSLFGVVEERWTLFRDLAMNLAHLVWIREIQLAAFAGIGGAFDTVAGQQAVFAADVGGGVRVHYEYGGVQPGVITIDIGYPLYREDTRVFNSDGELVRYRNPIGFYVGFDQYF